jgi:hypothetical protein
LTTAGAARFTIGANDIFMVAKSGGGARFGVARAGAGAPRREVCASDREEGSEQAASRATGKSARRVRRISKLIRKFL